MADSLIKRCPSCGKITADGLIAECPDCKVPLVHGVKPQPALNAEQLNLIARQILGSWKFWFGLIVIVGLAAWGVVQLSQRFIDLRSNQYLNTLGQQATNHIGVVSEQISNQILREFQQPRIRAAMEQIADDRANDFFTNAVWPSLKAFRQGLDDAYVQLAKSTNDLAALVKEVHTARQKAAPAAPAAANSPDTQPKLVMVDQNVARSGSNYILSVFFKSSSTGNQPIGLVDLIAGTYRQTARIVNFAAVTPGQTDPAVMNDLGDAARLKFTPPRSDTPIVVALEVTAPTIVRVSGEALEGDLTIPIAAENLPPPTTSSK